MKPTIAAVLALLISAVPLLAAEARPYVDATQLDVPWPKHSHYKQPWRAYMQTRSGVDFLNGIGVAFHSPGNDELAIRLLAEAGFHAFRVEVGWGGLSWDEKSFSNQARLQQIFRLLKQYNIRPTILLNAHHGVPCPMKSFNRKLAADAPKGSRTIKLADTRDIVLGRTGLSGLTDYWAAEALITAIDEQTGVCQLSKPLPKDLKAGANVSLATLKYLPLYPAGTPEFAETAEGWARYALLACKLAADADISDFDVEIWNELTFGTKFLTINNYYDKKIAPEEPGGGFLHQGGRCWELANRTIKAVKAQYSARCIWGFSNTTFFHTPIAKLPPRTDGQSYHPYGTGTRSLPRDEAHKDRPEFCIDGYIPTVGMRIPEGYAHIFVKTESLIRLINPTARQAHPPETQRFYHYMTEHGVVPPECGVNDDAGSWSLKTKCALRSFCMYLNKGIDVLHFFQAYDSKATGMGLLPINIKSLPADAKFDNVATPPMKAVRNLTRAFAASVPLQTTRQLDVQFTPIGKVGNAFEGDAAHPPLSNSDLLAILPFQTTQSQFVIPVYVMSYDAIKPFVEERYLLTISGAGAVTRARLYDPVTDTTAPLQVRQQDNTLSVEVLVTDYPRLLIIE